MYYLTLPRLPAEGGRVCEILRPEAYVQCAETAAFSGRAAKESIRIGGPASVWMGPPGLNIRGAKRATSQARLDPNHNGRATQRMDWRNTHLDRLYTSSVA